MRTLVRLVLACALVVAACGGVPQIHSVVIPGADRIKPLPVEVDDRAGIVASIEFNGADQPPFEPVVALPGDPTAIAVTWTGGLCDTGTRLTITRDATGIRIVETTRARDGACLAAGIYRSLIVRLVEPIRPGDFAFDEDP